MTGYIFKQPNTHWLSLCRYPPPRELEIPFGPQVPPFPVSAVFFVSAVPFRHRSLAKRKGASRRTGLRGKGGRRGGWCRGRIWSGRRPPFPFCFPNALHHSVWPKMVQRETQVQTEISKTGVDLHWQECQTEPPAREGTKNRSRKLYKDGSFTK